MANSVVTAVGIKKLYHFDPDEVKADLTAAALKTLLGKAKEITNVHQDTWQIEESESSQDSYKNQLTGSVYRMGVKTMGEVTYNFTIGRYDYETKQFLLGGTVIKNSGGDAIGWKRERGIVELKRGFIALTADDQYAVLPYANVNTREANTDGAIGLAVVATMMEPEVEAVASEYWFDKKEVEPNPPIA